MTGAYPPPGNPLSANPEGAAYSPASGPAAANPEAPRPDTAYPDTGRAGAERPAPNPLYRIDPARARQLGRSPEQLIISRLPEGSPSVSRPGRLQPTPAALIEEPRRFHELDEEFIRPEMPIKEIVFRTLLTRGNQPMGLQELAAELNDRWATPLRPIAISPRRLQAALDGDAYYGFAPAPGN